MLPVPTHRRPGARHPPRIGPRPARSSFVPCPVHRAAWHRPADTARSVPASRCTARERTDGRARDGPRAPACTILPNRCPAACPAAGPAPSADDPVSGHGIDPWCLKPACGHPAAPGGRVIVLCPARGPQPESSCRCPGSGAAPCWKGACNILKQSETVSDYVPTPPMGVSGPANRGL